MTIKEIIKPFVPDYLLQYRRDRLCAKVINEHKGMSRPEIEAWLAQCYREKIGVELDLENPARYTEKIQWCKLYAMDERKSTLSDKYAVREWVASLIGNEYLIPLLGVWDSPDKIDFNSLPKSFTLKTNHGYDTNIIVSDKSKLNISRAKRQLRRWLDLDFGWVGFERQYMRIPPRIIAEEYISNKDGSEIADYKVLCFSGEPAYVWVDLNRHSNHTRVVFDVDWIRQPWVQYHYPYQSENPERPKQLEEMLEKSRVLSDGFAHARVDFYIVNDALKFGEMTFTNGCGFEEIHPDEWDLRLGSLWDLSKEPRAEFPVK